MNGPLLNPSALSPGGVGTAVAPLRLTQASLLGLEVGMEVELRPGRLLGPQMLEAELRLPAAGNAWGPAVRVQLTAPLPATSLTSTLPLRAEVVALGPLPSLRLLPQEGQINPYPGQTPNQDRTWLHLQLRQHWPGARALAPGLQQLAEIALGLSAPDDQALSRPVVQPVAGQQPPAQVQGAIARLLAQLATVGDLTDPERLMQAIGRSGLWLEAQLAQAGRHPGQAAALHSDLKAQLLALAESLRSGASSIAQHEAEPLRLADRSPIIEAPHDGVGTETLRSEEAIEGGRQERDEAKGARLDEGHAWDQAAAEGSLGEGAEGPESASLEDLAPSESMNGEATAGESTAADDSQAGAQRIDHEDPRLGRLEREVEGMIKQLVTRQLQTLDTPAGQLYWSLELPFKTPSGVMALEADIQRAAAEVAQGQDIWTVRLRLNLPRLGPLYVRLALYGGQLTGCLQASEAKGAAELGQHLDALRTRLEGRNLRVAGLYIGQGPGEAPTPPCQTRLLSERA